MSPQDTDVGRSARSTPLLVTIGDPAGVGPEIVSMAWAQREEYALPPFACIADIDDLKIRLTSINMNIPVRLTRPGEICDHFPHALPVIHNPLAVRSTPGKPDVRNAPSVIQSIESAVCFIANSDARAIITCPIQKTILADAGFPFPGHTEYLGALAKQYFGQETRPIMMFVRHQFRTVPVTIHIPLRKVPDTLTPGLISETGRIVIDSLIRHFHIPQPRIAVCGLNPHAGESGKTGFEEKEIIFPAIAELRTSGFTVEGPFPADSLFQPSIRHQYDAILGMYHDQALIPMKTLSLDDVVNVSFGLPFVRTSPAHGTALDLAGSGHASPKSLIQAILLAASLSSHTPVP